jgi:protein-S-isoprenylcysteine O-methyltransferase Ste14
VRIFRLIAALVFFLNLPIPLYWLALHPLTDFWRQRVRAAFWVAGLGAWTTGGISLALLWRRLIAAGAPSIPAATTGVVLVAADIALLWLSARALGPKKLVGHAELTGQAEMITQGIYGRLRHPRYAGMIVGMLGAGLLAGGAWIWRVLGAWALLVAFAMALEEREMHRRFGAEYEAYCRRVPRFLPRWQQ